MHFALLAGHFKEIYQRKKETVVKVCYFIFHAVAVAVTHNAANGLDTVNSGDVNNPLNGRMLVAL